MWVKYWFAAGACACVSAQIRAPLAQIGWLALEDSLHPVGALKVAQYSAGTAFCGEL